MRDGRPAPRTTWPGRPGGHRADERIHGAALNVQVRFEDISPGITIGPKMSALMARVSVKCAPDLSTDEMRKKYPESIRLTLTLNDGRSATAFCGVARRMPEKPLSDKELLEKFHAAEAYAGLSLPRVNVAGFEPMMVFEQAVGEGGGSQASVSIK